MPIPASPGPFFGCLAAKAELEEAAAAWPTLPEQERAVLEPARAMLVSLVRAAALRKA